MKKFRKKMLFGALICVAAFIIFTAIYCAKDLNETEDFIKQTDAFIELYED